MHANFLKNFFLLLFLPFSMFSALSIENLPKGELHLHLGGAYPLEYLHSISSKQDFEALENYLDQINNRISYQAAFHVFQLIGKIVNTEQKIKEGVHSLCDWLKADGVTYVEIRSGLKDLGGGFEGYLKAALDGINMSTSENFQAKVLLSIQRTSTYSFTKSTIDLALKYQNLGVVGIEISGISNIGDIQGILPLLVDAKKQGIPFIVHLGETEDETDQMLLLSKLEPIRIGHGVFLSEEAKNWVLKNKIPIEVCLTSSFLVSMVESIGEHPGLRFYKEGHPIILCTDDPLIFRTSLSKEYRIAKDLLNLSDEDIKQLSLNSFKYAIRE